jgi:isochorismate pyruvate lyase
MGTYTGGVTPAVVLECPSHASGSGKGERETMVQQSDPVAGSLDDVRAAIDQIDRRLVALVAERERWVRQAARFKTSRADVEAPARVEKVIARVRGLAESAGASPEVVERLYRAMIAAFIELEDAERGAG